MKTLLRIDASARTTGSHSRTIANYYQSKWEKAHSKGKVITRDLALEPVPHLSDMMIRAFFEAGGKPSPATALSDTLIEELKAVDHVLISSPLYNLSLPSTLKAYLDYVVRPGMTLTTDGGKYIGLLSGRSATIITTRGSLSSEGFVDDFQTDYLKQILIFMGIGPIETVFLEGTNLPDYDKSPRLKIAEQKVDALFQTHDEPLWTGQLSSKDKKELKALQEKQANAIIKGDAAAYSKICTDDIKLMIPGHDIISGREKFQVAEENLFKNASFVKFRKYPERIDRSGDIAVEIGRQEIGMEKSSNEGGVYSAFQKYTHIYRLTSTGWRYAVLMSNQSN